MQGERPEHVLAWREEVMGRFRRRVKAAPHNTNAAEVRRLHAWDACCTGDGRGDAPEHYHGPWCSGNDVQCKANCIEAALQMIMPLPEMYSRRSFHGHLRCVDHIIALEAVGMLRETFSAAKAHRPIRRRGGASQPIAQSRGLLARPWAGPEQSEDVKEPQRFARWRLFR